MQGNTDTLEYFPQHNYMVMIFVFINYSMI